MAQVTMKAMLDAGVHFGHQTQRWNPKMKPYVFTARGGIHIIDLHKSVDMAKKAADFVQSVASNGRRLMLPTERRNKPLSQSLKRLKNRVSSTLQNVGSAE